MARRRGYWRVGAEDPPTYIQPHSWTLPKSLGAAPEIDPVQVEHSKRGPTRVEVDRFFPVGLIHVARSGPPQSDTPRRTLLTSVAVAQSRCVRAPLSMRDLRLAARTPLWLCLIPFMRHVPVVWPQASVQMGSLMSFRLALPASIER